ncbi:MAG: ABC transporter permease [Bacteroidetes bacterium]|nr:ABC transporter permease [Bacteroidota bacterium]
MNFEWFVVKRLLSKRDYKDSISAPIIKIAIAAVAIGMVVMLVAVATGIGLQKKIREKVVAFHGHIQISNYDNNQSKISLFPISKQQPFYPDFKTVQSVRHIQAVANKAGIIRMEDAFEGVVVKGIGSDFDWSQISEYLIAGELPDFSGALNEKILISKYLADRLRLEVGSRISTYFLKDETDQTPNLRVFEVAGIFDSGFREFDESYLFADIRHIQRINKWNADQIGHFEVFIDDFDQLAAIGNQVYQNTPSTLDTQTVAEAYYAIFEWLSLFDFNIFLVLGIMILVAGINMITALLVLILERTPMIGLFKSLGSTNQSIRRIFLMNATYLIGIGLLIGNLIGLLLIGLQAKWGLIKLDPTNYYVDQAPVYLSLTHWLMLNLGTLILCFLMMVVPSFIVARILPAQSIRFQ